LLSPRSNVEIQPEVWAFPPIEVSFTPPKLPRESSNAVPTVKEINMQELKKPSLSKQSSILTLTAPKIEPPKPSQDVTHPAFCAASGTGLNNGIAGEACMFTIQAKDAFGSDRSRGGDKFQVLLHGPAFLEAEVRDVGDGTYSVTYIPQVKGIYDVFVGVGGIQISEVHLF